MKPSRRYLAVAAISLLMGVAGLYAMRRVVLSFDLDEKHPDFAVKKDLATLRLAVEEYHEVNKRWPDKLDDALMSMPSRPMREQPKLPIPGATWGYRPEDGHVWVDSTHTDSRGNRWNAY